jgi:hypothetical protein
LTGVEDADFDDVQKLHKHLTKPREDIIFEVLQLAKQQDIKVAGAPFEAEWHLVSLLSQGVIDYTWSSDSDIPT